MLRLCWAFLAARGLSVIAASGSGSLVTVGRLLTVMLLLLWFMGLFAPQHVGLIGKDPDAGKD